MLFLRSDYFLGTELPIVCNSGFGDLLGAFPG
jgi:hypothetical protein